MTTLVIRALLFPIMGWNLRTQRRIQREQRQVAPQLNEIRKRYKGQTRKISEESQKVYAEHGISPFSSMSGCVPLLVQLPVLYGLYWGIRDVIGMDSTGASRVTFDALPKSFNFGFLWIHNVAQTIGQAIGSATSNVDHGLPPHQQQGPGDRLRDRLVPSLQPSGQPGAAHLPDPHRIGLLHPVEDDHAADCGRT